MLHTLQQKSSGFYSKNLPKIVPIAPAPERHSMDLQTEVRRYNSRSNPYTGGQAASIARRNARERNRVKQVNDGFNALRKRLPAAVIAALSGGSRRGSGKKISKVDTLRMVVEYIRYLEKMIDDSDAALGISKLNNSNCEIDEGVFGENSPYSEPAPSPTSSECSSGVSSAYSSGNYANYSTTFAVSEQKLSITEENELLDAISWWQQK